MKKLITLTFALLFSVGIVFGQTVVEVEQSGRNNTTRAEQHLTDDYNQPAEIYIQQEGRSNYAKTIQNATDHAGEYISSIEQAGRNNIAKQSIISSTVNKIAIEQEGRSNFATQNVHNGVYNGAGGGLSEDADLNIEQAGRNNYATQNLGVDGGPDQKLQGSINQEGRNNTALQEMYGTNQAFSIEQNGRTNYAKQVVHNGHAFSNGNFMGAATIEQEGRRNVAKQFMHGSNQYEVLIEQGGRSNFAFMDITAYNLNTEATIEQDGRNHSATIIID